MNDFNSNPTGGHSHADQKSPHSGKQAGAQFHDHGTPRGLILDLIGAPDGSIKNWVATVDDARLQRIADSTAEARATLLDGISSLGGDALADPAVTGLMFISAQLANTFGDIEMQVAREIGRSEFAQRGDRAADPIPSHKA